MRVFNSNISLILEFPKDKLSRTTRQALADDVATLLRVPVFVFDKDCLVSVIQHDKGKEV